MVPVSGLLAKEGTCMEGLMVLGINLMVVEIISVLQCSRMGKCHCMDLASKITE
jgi:hypothetical protein